MLCILCQSESFYEDYQQGGLICSTCGTQSQDFRPEVVDIDDEGMNMLAAKSAGGRYRVEKLRKTKIKSEVVGNKCQGVDPFAFLLAYQHLLKCLVDHIARHCWNDDFAQRSKFDSSVRTLWKGYIDSWKGSCFGSIEYALMRVFEIDDQRALNAHRKENNATTARSHSFYGDVRSESWDGGRHHIIPATSTPSANPLHYLRRPTDDASNEDASSVASKYSYDSRSSRSDNRFPYSSRHLSPRHIPQHSSSSVNAGLHHHAIDQDAVEAHLARYRETGIMGDLQAYPPFPSKPLMLGLVYLSFRRERVAIIPADIVRWCHDGIIPYNSLWDFLPETMRVKLSKSMRRLFRRQHRGNAKLVSPTNVLFHTSYVNSHIHPHRSLPSLNGPLIARTMIARLGMPEEVWTNFVKICQLHSPLQPLPSFRTVNIIDETAENIMAMVMVAYKMCLGWLHFSLVKDTATTGTAVATSLGSDAPTVASDASSSIPLSLPHRLTDIAHVIPRGQLRQFLRQTQRACPKVLDRIQKERKFGAYLYNNISREILQAHVDLDRGPLPVTCSSMSDQPRYGYDNDRFSNNSAALRSGVAGLGSEDEFNAGECWGRFTEYSSGLLPPSLVYFGGSRGMYRALYPDNNLSGRHRRINQYSVKRRMTALRKYVKESSRGGMHEKGTANRRTRNSIGGMSKTSSAFEELADIDSGVDNEGENKSVDGDNSSMRRERGAADGGGGIGNLSGDIFESSAAVELLSSTYQDSGEKSGSPAAGSRCLYLTHARYVDLGLDRTGLHVLPYIVLLERCARYMHVLPAALHAIVMALELELFKFVSGEPSLAELRVEYRRRRQRSLRNNYSIYAESAARQEQKRLKRKWRKKRKAEEQAGGKRRTNPINKRPKLREIVERQRVHCATMWPLVQQLGLRPWELGVRDSAVYTASSTTSPDLATATTTTGGTGAAATVFSSGSSPDKVSSMRLVASGYGDFDEIVQHDSDDEEYSSEVGSDTDDDDNDEYDGDRIYAAL